jgi:hypothetical protein
VQGLSLHGTVHAEADDGAALERLPRYISRAGAAALEQLCPAHQLTSSKPALQR